VGNPLITLIQQISLNIARVDPSAVLLFDGTGQPVEQRRVGF
jgi:hypothetical protein